ncbi:cytochrome P450 [Meredithblackwellia eburnea MCA 4105]
MDKEHAARWVNMCLVGFTGNTSEQPGWAFMHMLQSPKLWEVVKAEVDALPSGSLVDVDFKRQTPYLASALQETLRLCTAVFAGRTATDVTEVEGCSTIFPKGALIRTMSRAASFDVSVWGADADAWIGDRFVKNTDLYGKELHFGGGVSGSSSSSSNVFSQYRTDHRFSLKHSLSRSSLRHRRTPPSSRSLDSKL